MILISIAVFPYNKRFLLWTLTKQSENKDDQRQWLLYPILFNVKECHCALRFNLHNILFYFPYIVTILVRMQWMEFLPFLGLYRYLGVKTCEVFPCFLAIVRSLLCWLFRFLCFTLLASVTGSSYAEDEPILNPFLPCYPHFALKFVSYIPSMVHDIGWYFSKAAVPQSLAFVWLWRAAALFHCCVISRKSDNEIGRPRSVTPICLSRV